MIFSNRVVRLFLNNFFLCIKALFCSVYFNFRVLPFRQAIHLPFLCFVWPSIEGKGEVRLDCPVKMFMLRLGFHKMPVFPQHTLIWSNKGTIVFKGICDIGHHLMIRVYKDGYLEFGNQVALNSGCRVACQHRIVFKQKVRVSWECQFYDTNFHPIMDLVANRPVKMTSPIIIGEDVWIGHNVIISKGVKLADGIIVSSGSVVKNSFKLPNCIISGNPAVKISEGYRAEFDNFRLVNDFS